MELAGPQNNWHYNKKLQPYANSLRKNMTKAEAVLWKHVLRAGMMHGYTFRRQRPVLNYIADFMCQKLLLIIEVDGFTHEFPQIYEKDATRQEELEAVGFFFLRFKNREVLTEIDRVRFAIAQCVEERAALFS